MTGSFRLYGFRKRTLRPQVLNDGTVRHVQLEGIRVWMGFVYRLIHVRKTRDDETVRQCTRCAVLGFGDGAVRHDHNMDPYVELELLDEQDVEEASSIFAKRFEPTHLTVFEGWQVAAFAKV